MKANAGVLGGQESIITARHLGDSWTERFPSMDKMADLALFSV